MSEVDTEYINAVVARLFEPDTQDTPEDDDWISKLEVQGLLNSTRYVTSCVINLTGT